MLVLFGFVVVEEGLVFILQFLGHLVHFCPIEFCLFIKPLLQHFVFFGPLAVFAPLPFQIFIRAFQFFHVLLSQFFRLVLVLLLPCLHLSLQKFVFLKNQLVVGSQFSNLRTLFYYLHVEGFYLFSVVQLEFVDDLHSDDVCIIDPEIGVDASEFLILDGEEVLDFCDLRLVLVGDVGEVGGGVVELGLDLGVVILLDPQGVLDFVDDLVGAVELLESVLVGQLLPAHLLPQQLDLADVFLEVAADRLH